MIPTEITANCGHIVRAVLSPDSQRAMTEIEQLASGLCMTCRPRRHSFVNLSGIRIYVEE